MPKSRKMSYVSRSPLKKKTIIRHYWLINLILIQNSLGAMVSDSIDDQPEKSKAYEVCHLNLGSKETHEDVETWWKGAFPKAPKPKQISLINNSGVMGPGGISGSCSRWPKCKVLIVSGHYVRGFLGQKGSISLDELQALRCARKCEDFTFSIGALINYDHLDADLRASHFSPEYLGRENLARKLRESGLRNDKASAIAYSEFSNLWDEQKTLAEEELRAALAPQASETLVVRDKKQKVSETDFKKIQLAISKATLPSHEVINLVNRGLGQVLNQELSAPQFSQCSTCIQESIKPNLQNARCDLLDPKMSESEKKLIAERWIEKSKADPQVARLHPLLRKWVQKKESTPKFSESYFTIEELRALANEPLSPNLKNKLDEWSKKSIRRDYGPKNPEVQRHPLLGPVVRVSQYNIARGEKLDELLESLGPHCLDRSMSKLDPAKTQKFNKEEYADLLTEGCRLAGSDVLILNEDTRGDCRNGNRAAGEEIAIKLGMNYAFSTEFIEVDPELTGEDKSCSVVEGVRNISGNSVLSRYPIEKIESKPLKVCHDWYEDERKIPLPQRLANRGAKWVSGHAVEREIRRGGRSFQMVTVQSPKGPVMYVNVHLENKTSPKCRASQMQMVMDEIKDVKIPVVLAGDLNTTQADGSTRSFKNLTLNAIKTQLSPENATSTAVSSALGVPGIGIGLQVANNIRNRKDPTAGDYKWIPFFNNPESKTFKALEDSGFEMDGDKTRALDNRGRTLSHLNERTSKGFEPTFKWKRQYGFAASLAGLPDEAKLDWLFYRPGAQGALNRDCPKPYFGQTLEKQDKALMESAVPSDHRAITVDFQLDCSQK